MSLEGMSNFFFLFFLIGFLFSSFINVTENRKRNKMSHVCHGVNTVA